MAKSWLIECLNKWGGGITINFVFLVDGAFKKSWGEYETPPDANSEPIPNQWP